MTEELENLYQEVILDHYKRPRNWGRPPECDGCANGHNPLCGDRMTVYVTVENDIVKDVKIEGNGCAISVASASLMSEAVKGRTLEEVRAMFERFHDVVTGRGPECGDMGKLAVFAGVAEYPARVKCASLAWHTVKAALDQRDEHDGEGKPVSTE